jgi:hypothetical protein
MSHFTVLVIGDDAEKQLQPFHEYECTGTEDEYVVDVDKTEEVQEWLKEEIFVGKNKDTGEEDFEYNEESAKESLNDYQKITRQKDFENKNADIEDEIKEYFGYDKREGKWFRKTNPNAKWDWYQLGGRWHNFFKLKPGAKGKYGDSSLLAPTADEAGYADAALKKDIDFEGMRDEAGKKAFDRYEDAMKVIGHLPPNESWESLRERFQKEGKSNDEARDAYWAQERCVACKSVSHENDPAGLRWDGPDAFLVSQEEYVKNARNAAISTFAVIKDGKWYEKGSMGWWAIVSDENSNWGEEFAKLLDEVADDTMISVYDCHI